MGNISKVTVPHRRAVSADVNWAMGNAVVALVNFPVVEYPQKSWPMGLTGQTVKTGKGVCSHFNNVHLTLTPPSLGQHSLVLRALIMLLFETSLNPAGLDVFLVQVSQVFCLVEL